MPLAIRPLQEVARTKAPFTSEGKAYYKPVQYLAMFKLFFFLNRKGSVLLIKLMSCKLHFYCILLEISLNKRVSEKIYYGDLRFYGLDCILVLFCTALLH